MQEPGFAAQFHAPLHQADGESLWVALPLPYTVYERPTYSVVPSNAIWRDTSRPEVVALLRQNE